MANVKHLLSRRAKALNDKKNWEPMLQKGYRYSQPNRNLFDWTTIGNGMNIKSHTGQNLNWYVFDNTCSHATDIYVNRYINALTPPGKKWLQFVPGSEVPEEYYHDVKQRLQKNTDKFFNKYIHPTNFQLVMGEAFYDMTVSTGFMIANPGFEKKQKIVFASSPPDKTYASEGPYGTFDAFFRDWTQVPKEHAQAMWDGIRLPDKDLGDSEPKERFEFNLFEIFYKNYQTQKWEHVVIEEQDQEICYEQVHQSSPMVGFREKKLSGEVYGRGKALDAMPAAATINQAMYDEIMSANFRALPMYMGFGDGVFNPENFKMVPNTVLSCSPVTAGTWPLQPVPPAGDIQWASLVINDLREQINQMMMTAPFGQVDDPRKTATEIIERQREIAENASASFSRIQRELFDPLVERIVDIMKMNGDWDEPSVDGELIDIAYETPLVISQGQKEVLDFLQYDQYVKQVYGPEASTSFYNIESIPAWMADKLNVDLNLVKNAQEMVAILEQASEQQQQMMDAQMSDGVAPKAQPLSMQQQGEAL